MNIHNPSAIRDCTSCQVCAAVCPKDAITIVLDEKGFYRPVIDDKCVDCSLCTKVCYKYNDIEISDKALSHYAAFARDENVLATTTSGGIAYLLSKALIEKGYKCVGVGYDVESDRAVTAIADNTEQINAFKGSKYIQSYTFDAFKQVLIQCPNEKIAVFGTPCHIYAIDKYLKLKNKRRNFLLIDIYCHGCPSLKIWRKYVSEIKSSINKERFDKVNFRSKLKGWGLFYIIEMTIGEKAVFTSNFRKDEFYKLFFSDYMLNEACYDCKLRSTFAYTDIRLGDFWGKCYVKNRKGVSLVSVITKQGEEAFDSIKNEIEHKEHKMEDFISFQSYGISYQYDKKIRKEMFALLDNNDLSLKDVVAYFYAKQSVSQKLKRKLKQLLLLLPPALLTWSKSLYYKCICK